VGDAVDEIAELVDGFGIWLLRVRNASAPIPKSQEVKQLPDLQAAADAASGPSTAAAAMASARRRCLVACRADEQQRGRPRRPAPRRAPALSLDRRRRARRLPMLRRPIKSGEPWNVDHDYSGL
jgi:hypothetical protein